MAKNSKKTLVIENTTAHVVVLKAVKQKPLRLFPGYNNIAADTDFAAFFEGNKAAQGNIDDGTLKPVDADTLSDNETKLAQAAKEKNDSMNKAYKVIKANKLALVAKDEALAAQAEEIAVMKTALEVLKETVAQLTAAGEKKSDEDK